MPIPHGNPTTLPRFITHAVNGDSSSSSSTNLDPSLLSMTYVENDDDTVPRGGCKLGAAYMKTEESRNFLHGVVPCSSR